MARGTPKPRRSPSRSGRREVARGSQNRGRILAALSIAVFIVAVAITTRNTLRRDAARSSAGETSEIAAAPMDQAGDVAWDPTADPLWPEISEVAGNFLCGCGECGDMPLVECVCTMENGGIPEKRFIRNLLEAGLTPGEAIPLVERRFKRRIQPEPGLGS